jgi:hypothetical protein
VRRSHVIPSRIHQRLIAQLDRPRQIVLAGRRELEQCIGALDPGRQLREQLGEQRKRALEVPDQAVQVRRT